MNDQNPPIDPQVVQPVTDLNVQVLNVTAQNVQPTPVVSPPTSSTTQPLNQLTNEPSNLPAGEAGPTTNQPTDHDAQVKAQQATNQQNIDDIAAQAAAIQDLFAKNDQLVPSQVSSSTQPTTNSQIDLINQLTGDPTNQPVTPTDLTDQPTTNQPPQKSPLDILEEILAKEKATVAPSEPSGPTPEEIEAKRQQELAEQALLEQQRQKVLAETQTAEQQHRDAIRHQQQSANKVNNPYEIRQLEKKTGY